MNNWGSSEGPSFPTLCLLFLPSSCEQLFSEVPPNRIQPHHLMVLAHLPISLFPEMIKIHEERDPLYLVCPQHTPQTLAPNRCLLYTCGGFPSGAVVKNLLASSGDAADIGSIPGSGRSPGVGNGNPRQYCCQDNPTDRGAWQAIIHRVTKRQTWVNEWAFIHTHFTL